jgi:very-short-patch-repair endonuclease
VPFTPDGVIFSRPRLLTTVSHQDIYYRAKIGRLHRIHRGVYPRYNVLVAGLTVDVFWPEWKLVVELDGRPYHSSPRSCETDRIRDATLQKHDLRVLRVTGNRLDNEPGEVLSDILALRRMR